MKMITNILAYITATALAATTLSSCTPKNKQQASLTLPPDTSAVLSTVYAQFTPEYSDRDSDASYKEASATKINLSGTSATIDGSGAVMDGSSVKITSGGTYIISGTLSGGSVIIEAPEADKVQLVLSNADITSTDGPAIYEKQCDKLFVTLVGDNKLSDSTQYTLAEGEDEPNAALFTKHDISINGSGTLTVNGLYKHGILSKDDLKITGGTINVTSVNDGIRGRDSVLVKDGTINITAEGDGIQSNNDSAEDKGRISIDSGKISITAKNDGIQAESVLQINGGTLNINSGDPNAEIKTENGFGGGMPMGGGPRGGMNGGMPQTRPEGNADMAPPDTANGERPTPPEGGMDGRPRGGRGGMPPEWNTEMTAPENESDTITDTTTTTTDTAAGETTSDSKKGLKSANALYISGGTITVASEDDAVHSDIGVTVNNGTLNLSTADDALHAEYICTINGGNIKIAKCYEGLEGKAVIVNGGTIDINAADDAVNASDPATSGSARPGRGNDEVFIDITGGTIKAAAGFDCLDSNGNVFVRGGTVTLDGPSNGMDCAIDCDGRAYVHGGTVAASGTSGGSTSFDNTSGQPSITVVFTSQQSAGTAAALYDESGKEIAKVTPTQSYRGVIFSSELLEKDKTYTVKAGDISVSVEQSDTSVSVNENGEAVSGGMGGPGGMPGGMGGDRGGRGNRDTAQQNTQ